MNFWVVSSAKVIWSHLFNLSASSFSIFSSRFMIRSLADSNSCWVSSNDVSRLSSWRNRRRFSLWNDFSSLLLVELFPTEFQMSHLKWLLRLDLQAPSNYEQWIGFNQNSIWVYVLTWWYCFLQNGQAEVVWFPLIMVFKLI